jgi:hypothetical protein
MQRFDFKRRVVLDDVEYFVEVRRSLPRHIERFATPCYALVELPDAWTATVPVPECVLAAGQLWYRELIELVQRARILVGRRTAA